MPNKTDCGDLQLVLFFVLAITGKTIIDMEVINMIYYNNEKKDDITRYELETHLYKIMFVRFITKSKVFINELGVFKYINLRCTLFMAYVVAKLLIKRYKKLDEETIKNIMNNKFYTWTDDFYSYLVDQS